MGKMDRALAEREKAIRLTPADPRLIQVMGEYSDICGQLERALACYDRVLAEKPHDAGQMYLLANDTSEAMACFELLIKTNPQSFTGYWDRAQVYDLKNEKSKAAADMAKARKLDLDY